MSIVKKQSVVVGIVFCGMLAIGNTAFAQSGHANLIYQGSSVLNVSWSTDSHLLVFDNTDETGYRSYDVITQKSAQGSAWPLQPKLNAADEQLLKPAINQPVYAIIYIKPYDDKGIQVWRRRYPTKRSLN